MSFTNTKKFSSRDNGKYSDLTAIPPFKAGINNRSDIYNLPDGSLTEAINVDIDNNGVIKRRKNTSRKIEGDCHSLWNDSLGTGYMVLNGVLVKILKDGTTELIDNGLTDGLPLCYLELNNEIYYSDGKTHSGKINSLGSYEIWSIESPMRPPTVNFTTGGNLPQGTYIVAYSYMYGDYETGISEYLTITTPDKNGRLEVSAPPSSDSTSVNIYITPCNSQVLGLYKTGQGQFIKDIINLGRSVKKEVSAGFPPLNNISASNGRIFGSRDNYIYWTFPYDYRQFDPTRNSIGLDSDIVLFKTFESGAWIVTKTSTYWLSGNNFESDNSSLQKVLPYGAIPGTLFVDEDKKTLGWLSTKGYILADTNGKIDNLTEKTFEFPDNYESGAALYRKHRGIKQVIFSLKNTGDKTGFEVSPTNEEFDLEENN